MRRRTAALLAALATLAAVATLLLEGGAGETRLPAATPMFPGLAAKLADAARIEVVHQGQTLTLIRDGDSWRLPQHAGFPADPAAVHGLLAGIAALRLLEPRTADPAMLARLGLEDPSSDAAASTLVRVRGAADVDLASVVLGGDIIGGQGDARREDIYVRRPEEGQAWLAEPLLAAPPDWLDWAGRTLVDLVPEDVVGIIVARAGAPRLELARHEDRFQLTTPADHPTLDRFKLDDVGRALSGLAMHDVRPAAHAPGPRLGEATFTTRQGLAITVGVHAAAGETWLDLAAHGDNDASAPAAALSARFTGWAFAVDHGREAALLPSLADLAAYPSPPASAAAPSALAPAPAAPPPKPGRR